MVNDNAEPPEINCVIKTRKHSRKCKPLLRQTVADSQHRARHGTLVSTGELRHLVNMLSADSFNCLFKNLGPIHRRS